MNDIEDDRQIRSGGESAANAERRKEKPIFAFAVAAHGRAWGAKTDRRYFSGWGRNTKTGHRRSI